ncbi:MAG: 23S rRNA (adenine(2503)-C(2))-methyltransferase RlmN [Tannerella sp.]|jgi:23S rRNA (adenine2503-C2)-methyltransferase|nr:23S rRNA (adenine(2503)-C(2))-methyltransferase RlmN [Tannerella sp.]
MEEKVHLLGMTIDDLKGVALRVGLPAYAAKQIADWIYKKKVTSIHEMTNLSLPKRNQLEELYDVGCMSPVDSAVSVDGTIKYLFSVNNGKFIESVFIPSKDRATLCVSSQVGCKMDCLFCMTGKQGFSANLTSNEILNQIQSIPELSQLTNLVFMGMGEPFDNTNELFKVLDILTADYGYGWSPKRITVSTIGLIKGLQRFLDESTCHLAISLHSPFPEERLALMPIEKVYPIVEVIQLIRQYDFAHQRRVSFEYIMFEGKNDSVQHAKALASLLKGISCRVNLIRYHAIPDVPLQPAELKIMELFCDTLNKKGITCTIRMSRGEDIMAACGMLSTAKSRQK